MAHDVGEDLAAEVLGLLGVDRLLNAGVFVRALGFPARLEALAISLEQEFASRGFCQKRRVGVRFEKVDVLAEMAAWKRCAPFELVLTLPLRISPALTFRP